MENINQIIQEVQELEETTNEKKRQEAQVSGRLEENLSTLKNTFELNNIEEAEKELESLQEKLEKNEEKITTSWKKIKEEYQW